VQKKQLLRQKKAKLRKKRVLEEDAKSLTHAKQRPTMRDLFHPNFGRLAGLFSLRAAKH